MPKSDKMISVSPARLKYAREYYGLSRNEVELKIRGITAELLEAYETGIDFPSYAKLEALANLYNRPLIYFFFRTEPVDEKLAVAFRGVEKRIGKSVNYKIRTLMEKADWFRLNLSELYKGEHLCKFVELIEQDKIRSSLELTEWLRDKLELPLEKQKKIQKASELLEYLREKLYDIGIYVFKESFRADEVSGLCLFDEEYPVILLNNKTSFTRQVFTVFHEIYHLFIKEPDVFFPTDREEKECDRFAGEFLIPISDFQHQISDRTFFEDAEFINELAKLYTVSPSAIAYRLLSLGNISSQFYSTIHDDGIRRSNAESSAGNFYYTHISYLGRPYLKSVLSMYYSGKIGVTTVGKYTGLKASLIDRLSSNMYGGML